MTRRGTLRRVLIFLAPAAVAAQSLSVQKESPQDVPLPPAGGGDDVRLPNGKSQREAILKADYEQNVKDAQELAARAREFEENLEKSDRYVLSLGLLKQLDEIERLTKRIRGRMRRS